MDMEIYLDLKWIWNFTFT